MKRSASQAAHRSWSTRRQGAGSLGMPLDVRDESERRGLDPVEVAAAFAIAQEADRDAHQRAAEQRAAVVYRVFGDQAWRADQTKIRRGWGRLSEADCDAVRGLDVVAAGLVEEFPELARDPDPTETVFRWLVEPYRPPRTRRQLWADALDYVERYHHPLGDTNHG